VRPAPRRYSREQIIQAGRWAWAPPECDDEPDVYFDGSAFWNGPKGRRVLAKAEAMPQEGWWHEKDCHCALCRPSLGS
jgi:hypothetical protein